LIEDVGRGFVRVEHNGSEGYASSLYLAADPAVVPYLSEGAVGCHRVALIFNIGIGDDPATEVLDLLAAEGVPATMFPMGWWAEQHPSILTRMVDEGYPVGSHGYAPYELSIRSREEVLADLHAATSAIEHATGAPINRLFTAYAAATNDRIRSIVAAEGFLPVQWKVPADDYGADATAEAVYSRVVDNIYDGAIVEFHLDGPASRVSTGVALPWIIGALRWEGYHFVTIPEMILDCH
jgi:peptidoglycan/xylan/chitin deacetylase (PgdA/CDA1 family)